MNYLQNQSTSRTTENNVNAVEYNGFRDSTLLQESMEISAEITDEPANHDISDFNLEWDASRYWITKYWNKTGVQGNELRNMGIPVINFTPSKGNDKHVRVNSISPLFEAGKIWAPMHEHFAQEVVEECASFPHGDHDDYVDSTTQAIMRLRGGMFITHPQDYKDEKIERKPLRYYG